MLTFAEIKTNGTIASELDNVGFPAVLKYLRDRGIGAQLIDDLGLQILPAAELIKRARGRASGDDRLAVVIPHFNIAGDYIDWWSARLIDTGLRPVVASFAALVPHKRGKMFCPPTEPPHAYLPPILDWRKLEKGDRIYIHESAIKAINGARLGRWSVGLNGVWGWGSRKHALALVQELKDLPWKALGLRPTIVFDSNALDNWDVQAAISQLAARLMELTGQQADHLLLPKTGDGTHQGFDDFCVAVGDDAARQFLDAEGVAVEISGVQLLKMKLNAEVAVVRSLGRIAYQSDGNLMTRAVFTDVNFAHYVAEVEDRAVNVPKLWLMDERRASVHILTYAPGRERIFEDKLNVWQGMALEPSRGDVQLWLRLTEKVKNERIRKWLIQWMSYPLQHLGHKLKTYVHLYGPPGSGKQAIFAPLLRIYGEANAIVIDKENLSSQFNSVYANKQFINLDEMHSGSDNDKINNKIKKLITDEMMVVNRKGEPEYRTPNCANFVSTSNYPDSIKFDDDDRRACVVQFGERGDGENRDLWEAYWRWLDEEGGAAAVFDYLLGVDLEGFDPNGWAPMTEAKAEATRATRRADEQWVDDLWEDPSNILPPVLEGRSLMTTEELAQYCYGGEPGGVTIGKRNALGIKLHTAGFKKRELKVDGKKVRFWIIREKGREWAPDECRAHLKSHKYAGA